MTRWARRMVAQVLLAVGRGFTRAAEAVAP
jgi:hypothetical protein